MSRLQIQIVVKNNEKTIDATLQSISSLNGQITIADLGSTDKTLEICQRYSCNVARVKEFDRSKIRNDLRKDDWNFYIEPWETLAYGFNEIKNIIKSNKRSSYFFQIIRSGTITKEIRLWSKNIEFCNPVYECLIDDKATNSGGIILSKSFGGSMSDVQIWKSKSPTSSEPYYYEACLLLSEGKYDDFLKTSNLYLFRDHKKVMPVTMIRYYCSLVNCHVKKDPIKAIQYLIPCITANPLMAEFWCLLGDIHYSLLKEYKKAYAFYDNAIFLGRKRLKSDLWPMEISKYSDYPEEMKKSCSNKISKTMFLGKG
jgi:glycosyltransferase involved in cell wall biosynthesis